jgi:hypothetical protein
VHIARLETLDALLWTHALELGRDFVAYRNHAYRVVNLCLAQRPLDVEQLEKVAIAAAFHDLGIWTDGTFDYLRPSVRLARESLGRAGKAAWADEIAEMILEHHKISAYRREDRGGLVELFRRADWMDVTRGALAFGVPRSRLRDVFAAWPAEGFRGRLVQLALARLRSHPGSPLPMLKL